MYPPLSNTTCSMPAAKHFLAISAPTNFEPSIFPPTGITYTVPKIDEIHVTGIDKELVGQCAAEIRAHRRPEPYHGKGIRYSTEVVRRKEIKKAAK